jgi:hypothetical protein
MDIKQQLDKILNKPMDREGFFKHVGLGLVAVAGATAVGKVLISQPKNQSSQTQALGYGDAAYGGKPNDANSAKASEKKVL